MSEDRLKTIEEKLDSQGADISFIKGMLEVSPPKDQVEIKASLARVETRVYGISAIIAMVGTSVVSFLKGLLT